MSTEYTPSVELMRSLWVENTFDPDSADQEFERFLNQIRAEAKAEALHESATELNRLDSDVEMYDENLRATQVEWWLRARANQYKENQS